MFCAPIIAFGLVSAVPRERGLVFIFCVPTLFFGDLRVPGLILMFYIAKLGFNSTKRVGSSVHVLRPRTHFRRYEWHRVQFLCFALLHLFSTVSKELGQVLMFSAAGLIYCGT
jgi:hypothetical protein